MGSGTFHPGFNMPLETQDGWGPGYPQFRNLEQQAQLRKPAFPSASHMSVSFSLSSENPAFCLCCFFPKTNYRPLKRAEVGCAAGYLHLYLATAFASYSHIRVEFTATTPVFFGPQHFSFYTSTHQFLHFVGPCNSIVSAG